MELLEGFNVLLLVVLFRLELFLKLAYPRLKTLDSLILFIATQLKLLLFLIELVSKAFDILV